MCSTAWLQLFFIFFIRPIKLNYYICTVNQIKYKYLFN